MTDDDKKEMDDDKDFVQKQARILMNRFDTVQIFITKHHVDHGTSSYSFGEGNYHARRDGVREWLMSKDERTKDAVRSYSP